MMIKLDDFQIFSSSSSRTLNLDNTEMISDDYLNQKFYIVYKMYNDYFLDYLDEKIGLKTIDDKLGKIGLFPPVNQDRKDIYQKFSKYNYFYIRNNLMIEKLDSSYIDELIERFNNNNFDYDDFAKNMIENTYVDVCDNYNIYGDISYGPTNGNFFAPANAIVLGCRADSRIKDGENVVEHFKKQGIIDDSIKTVNTNYRDEFDIPFKILMYDDYSVKPVNDFTFAEYKKKLK